ncbi:MAG: single-stranded DNA-binding protein [Hominimerdicola sp.]
MNKVILMGRLTADPDFQTSQSGKAYCRFSVAVSRPKQQDGSQQTDFISCTAWGKTAENIKKFFVKGKPIIVFGSLHNNNYTDKNGVQHYGFEVWVDGFDFVLPDKTQQQNTPQNTYQNYQNYQQNPYPNAPQPPHQNTYQNYPQNPPF